MKALIIGADAVDPDVIFSRRELFPTLGSMMDHGASAAYSAYVQKGYNGSYSSEQNWASIYTGLPPEEHSISTYLANSERRRPKMSDFDSLQPFWKVLNENGYTVGLWCADNCSDPVEIDGYAVYAKYDMIETPVENRLSPRVLQTNLKDGHILRFLDGNPPPRLYPQTIKQRGQSFEQLKQSPELAWQYVQKYHFQDAIPNFECELEYYFQGMRRAQRENPVDIMFFYTASTDLIVHCCKYCDENQTQINAYQLLDRYVGNFCEEFKPEIIVFMSDHGQQNFKELCKCADLRIQKETFSARDEVIWLPNGYIAFEAHNGALLFTYHSLTGTFIASGNGIRQTKICDMRTLDIYPTLLEMLGTKIPCGRLGFVPDIFDRPLVNTEKLIKLAPHKQIALIQTHEMSITDIILNELYVENRFADITVVGEEKYKEIFLNNPRITGFVSIGDFETNKHYDEVYCGFYNETTKQMSHIRVV
jgi:hypothetical protein